MSTRRQFIKASGTAFIGLQTGAVSELFTQTSNPVELCAHIWVYASKYPPDWDATPVLDQIFSDLSYAGFSGIEIMEPILRHDDAVQRLNELKKKYSIAVSGTSFGADMFKKEEHQKILEDIALITGRLAEVGGTTFGISVGDAGRKKTETELDAQAELLKKLMVICKDNNIEPNLHNHTYEMKYGMHDFKETIARVPELKLGPDLNWLVRAGVDPVWFIKTYGQKMVYMHLRDQGGDGKWTEALGEGVTNFRAISQAFRDIRYKGKAAVELAFEKEPVNPVRESWKKSREYVRKIFSW
jgi:sugar phosphate isomerase/epimerase